LEDKITPILDPVISRQQHGFVSGRSVTSNLALYTQYLLTEMENGCQVDAVYTDFSKAFDKMSIQKLVYKLANVGLCNALTRWLSNYLSGRSQYVKYNFFISKRISVTSGVPQGSHLGPLLFSVFVNDIETILRGSKLLLFADDCKIFRAIGTVSDAESFQNDLKGLETWCTKNEMDLNATKCKVITFGRSRTKILYSYEINGTMLET
jgi:hypothetical protein